jgi:hypothetical protein
MGRLDVVATVRCMPLNMTSEGHSGRWLRRLSLDEKSVRIERGVLMMFASYMNDWKITFDRDAFCIVGFIFYDDADPRVAAPMTAAHEPSR